jgi:pilus assembly protein FimV
MMRVETKQHKRHAIQFWMLFMTMSVAFNAQALGLGEIQLNSNLGEPLKAQVNLIELAAADARDLKAHLASIEEYKKIGLQYPDGIKFKFQFVNEQGKQPVIHISTLLPIDEPFLTLLLEVSSPSGKIVKDFTFLVDPAPDLFGSAVTVQPAANIQQAEVVVSGLAEAKHAIIEKPVARSAKPKKLKKRISGATSSALSGSLLRADSETFSDADGKQRARPSGKLSLVLSTSLSISRNAPSQPGNPIVTGDALQEELIAREKMLSELNAQITEMQAVIKALQIKLDMRTGSAVAASGVLAQSAAASSIPESAMSGIEAGKPKVPVPAITAPLAGTAKLSGSPNRYWSKAAAGITLLVLGAGAVFWYRKRKLKNEPMRGPFDDLNDSDNAVVQKEPAGMVKKAGEQPLKMPAYKGLKTVSVVSPEYDFIEQADIYLRFGHDKLAEDVLREAIKVNPINPHGYLTLLGIYETRGDADAFYALAQQLKAICDVADWKKVTEMGRKLDPANPFYA